MDHRTSTTTRLYIRVSREWTTFSRERLSSNAATSAVCRSAIRQPKRYTSQTARTPNSADGSRTLDSESPNSRTQ